MIKKYEFDLYGPQSDGKVVLYNKYIDTMAQLLRDSALFDSVEVVKPSDDTAWADYAVYGKINDNRIIGFSLYADCRANSGNTMWLCDRPKITAYYNNGDSYDVSGSAVTPYSNVPGLGFDSAYITSNGIMIRWVKQRRTSSDPKSTPTVYASVIIAKSGKEYPIIVPFTNGASGNDGTLVGLHGNGIPVVCYTDAAVTRTAIGSAVNTSVMVYNYNTTAKQSLLMPFGGWGGINEDFTYSKYAFWIPFAPASLRNGGYQKISVNGKSFVTDGYFALSDG
jgi:hypothetical protein